MDRPKARTRAGRKAADSGQGSSGSISKYFVSKSTSPSKDSSTAPTSVSRSKPTQATPAEETSPGTPALPTDDSTGAPATSLTHEAQNEPDETQDPDSPSQPIKPITSSSSSSKLSAFNVLLNQPSSAQTLKRKRPTPSSTSKPSNPAWDSLPVLPDSLAPNLLLLFCGLNPGIMTATRGHAYAHPTNAFWPLLHDSGLTPERRLAPSEDTALPRTHGYGCTNIVRRATKGMSDLTKAEMKDGARMLDERVRRVRPEVVCMVGKGIWEAWEAVVLERLGRKKGGAWEYGWQRPEFNLGRVPRGGGARYDAQWDSGPEKEDGEDGEDGEAGTYQETRKRREAEKWEGARLFVAASTSGQAAMLSYQDKLEIMKPLGEFVARRRAEREAEGSATWVGLEE